MCARLEMAIISHSKTPLAQLNSQGRRQNPQSNFGASVKSSRRVGWLPQATQRIIPRHGGISRAARRPGGTARRFLPVQVRAGRLVRAMLYRRATCPTPCHPTTCSGWLRPAVLPECQGQRPRVIPGAPGVHRPVARTLSTAKPYDARATRAVARAPNIQSRNGFYPR